MKIKLTLNLVYRHTNSTWLAA